jgi:hypothetical protein
VEYETQLNLKLSFGRPSVHILREPGKRISEAGSRTVEGPTDSSTTAEYWLWVYAGRWKVTLADGRSATAASPDRTRDAILNTLKGEEITGVRVQPKTGATHISFDLGGRLEIRRVESGDPDDLWILYKPRDLVLTLRSDGTYAHGPATGSNARWRPVEITQAAA